MVLMIFVVYINFGYTQNFIPFIDTGFILILFIKDKPLLFMISMLSYSSVGSRLVA